MPRERHRDSRSEPGLIVARWTLAAALFAGPLLFGAIALWAWAILGIFYLIALVCGLQARGAAPALPRLALLSIAILLVTGVIHLIPIPFSLAKHILPDRVAALTALAPAEDPGSRLAGLLSGALPPNPKWVSASFAPSATRDELCWMGLLAVVFVTTALCFRRSSHQRMLATAICASGAVAAAVGLLQLHSGGRRLWFFVPVTVNANPFGPYVNRNHFAGLVEIAFPLALALALDWWRVRRVDPSRALAGMVFSLGSAVVLAIALVQCGSRGGALGCAVGIVAMGVLLGRGADGMRLRRAALVLGVLVLVVLMIRDGRNLVARVAAVEATDGSMRTRLHVWRSTLALIARYPLLGTGFGAFEDAFPPFEKPPLPWVFEHPESDVLWLVAEGGAPAAVALGALVTALVMAVQRRLRRTSPERTETVWAAAVAGLMSLAFHALVDVNLHMPANAALAAALAAIVLVRSDSTDAVRQPPGRGRQVLLLTASLLAGAWLLRAAAADLLAASARMSLTRGRNPGAEGALLRRAVELDPQRAALRAAAATVHTTLSGGAPEAVGHWAWALNGRPYSAEAAFSLGWLLVVRPVVDAADAEVQARYAGQLLRRAAELDPSFPGFRIRYGMFLTVSRLGHLSDGLAEVRKALTAEPERQNETLAFLERYLPTAALSSAVPDTAENRWGWAVRLDHAGNLNAALVQYERTLKLANANREARARYRRQIADEHLRANRPALAIPLLEEVVAGEAADPVTLGRLGTAFAAVGRFDDARLNFERSLRLLPDPRIEQALAWVLVNLRNCEGATAAAGRALAKMPANPQALLVIGLCQEQRGDLGPAFKTLTRVLQLLPTDRVAAEALRSVERRMADGLSVPAPETP